MSLGEAYSKKIISKDEMYAYAKAFFKTPDIKEDDLKKKIND